MAEPTAARAALGIIDAQRGFIPVPSNGDASGFGELPVPDAEAAIPAIVRLIETAQQAGLPVFTTQDWHPSATAHFAKDGGPWPVHCVAGTPGAELHPDLAAAPAHAFKKGQAALAPGEEDLSYSGYFASDAEGMPLPEWLAAQGVATVYLAGLAFDYCVGATALDLAGQAGLAVTVVADATRPVAPETGEAMTAKLRQAGVELKCAGQAAAELAGQGPRVEA
jgi:nicotinamidase/pyrazinamidase